MEQLLAEYFVNSLWQVLLLAAGAWLLLRVLRPSPQIQHWIWIGVLPLLLLMPLLSLHSGVAPQVPVAVAHTHPTSIEPSDEAVGLPVPTQLLEHAVADSTSPQSSTLTPIRPDTLLGRIHWLPVRTINLGSTATLWVIGFYLATIAFALIRLLYALQTARRVIARATLTDLNREESLLVDQCCRRLGVTRPTILESSEVCSPMVVGVLRPLLLLPEDFANRRETSSQCPNRDLEAVLLHELAHLQRCDCLANLVCRIVALPIAYHPATWAVRQRIRQTQEMLCDAIAAAEMQSPVRYARCLVGLAQNMQRNDGQIEQVYGSTMFDGKILEERVMQLIQTRKAVNLRTQTMRLACGIAVFVAVIVVASTFHVTPTFAETPNLSQPDAIATQATGQSHPVDVPIEADAAESPQQIDQANQQFDAAMRIVHERLNRSSNSALRYSDAGAQFVTMHKQIDQAGIEAQIASAHDGAQSAQLAAQIERAQAKLDSPEFKKQMADIQAKFNSPEFKQKMKDAQAKFDNPEFKKKMADIQAKFDSPEFKQKMKDAQAKFDNPEFKKKMADIQAKFDSPEFKQKMKDAQAKFDNPEFKKQMADMQAKFDSPEFKQKMKDAQAKFDNPEFKKKMADIQARFNSAEFKQRMAEAQARFNDPEFRKKMEKLNSPELQKQIADATARANNPELRKQLEDLNQKYREQLQQILRQFSNEAPASSTAPTSPNP